LPPLAKAIETRVEVDAVALPLEPSAPEWLPFRPELSAAELLSVELTASGFSEEELELAKQFAEEQQIAEPPAGIAPPVALELNLQPVAPPKAAPIADFNPQPFTPAAAASLAADLSTLRSRYVRGPNPNLKPAEPPKPAEAPKAAEAPKPPAEKPEPAKPAEAPKPEPVKKEAAKPAEAAPKPAEPPALKPKISIRPPEPAKPSRPDVRRPTTMVARSNAQPIAHEVPEPALPLPPTAPSEPKVIPIRKPDPVAAPRITEAPMLGMSTSEATGSGMGMKIGIAVGVLAVLGGIGFFAMKGGSAKTDTPAVTTDADGTHALPTLGGAGWTTNWGTDAANNKGKQISLYRPTMAISDYRIEVQGQIEKKALGWIFRAHDPKNYYVIKLEWLKPGVEDPIPALVKYAVIDGKETTHTQVLLPLENVTLTTMFKIRTDVKGDKFTTWVNDKRVDYWNDDRITVGGAGLYAEANERAVIKSTNITGLR
jgi:hypothetical protein